MYGPGSYLLGQEEIDHVMDVLKAGELGRYRPVDGGPSETAKVYQFEREFEALTGSNHCLAVNSGTSALMACLVALGIGPGDEVIVPGYTFIASMSAVIHLGAVPVLAEIDESLTMDPVDAERKITPRTKAIMPVHMLGTPCDMEEIARVANRHGLHVVEDACQACGGSYKGSRLGTVGDMGAFSLNVYKTITAGDGGMLVTNDPQLFERAFAFHDQGNKPFRTGLADGDTILGINLRMNELTGAVALAQLRKIDTILEMLREKKRLFKSLLENVPGLRFRILNDGQGECATTLGLIFDSKEVADEVAQALSTKTLTCSGMHYYGNMVQLLDRNRPTAHGSAPHRETQGVEVTYSKGMLPQTDDVLSRSILLSVGVTDPNLGTDFGINILSDEAAIEAKAEELRDLTASVLSG